MFGFIFVATLAFATVKQYQAQKKQAKALNEANDMRRRQDLLQQAQQRQQQIRQARLAQARIAQAGANQGVALSSAVEGGIGSVGSQRSANLGFLNANSALSQAGYMFQSQAAKYGNQANMWGAVNQVSQTIGQAVSDASKADGAA